MSNYFSNIFHTTKSLFTGLGVTIREMFRKPVTVQYPREVIPVSPHFRGPLELLKKEEGGFRCIACENCARNCPSSCLTVVSRRSEESKKKVLVSFTQDFTRCSLCGICVEVCPASALAYSSTDVYLAGFTREEFLLDLIARANKGEGP